MSDRGPSAYKVEQAISAWQSARSRLLTEDKALAHDEAALAELLGDEVGDIDDILARVHRAALHAEMMEEAAALRIAQMTARKTRYAARRDTLRSTAFAMMAALERPNFEQPDFTAFIRKGNKYVYVSDETALPDGYIERETVTRVLKAKIAADLRQGVVIDGAEFADGPPSLVVKRT